MKTNVVLWALTAAATLAAADMPYAGKWKMNPAKSDFGAATITYSQLPTGEWQFSADGVSYKFKMDGKEYPNGMGDTAAWKSTGANSWEVAWKINGKFPSTDTLKLSADGKSLTLNTKGAKPNGDAIDDTATYQRVSGSAGLAGKWKTRNVKSSSPGILELAASDGDGLSFREPDFNLTCDAKLDSKDYPCTGPSLAPGWTVAMTQKHNKTLDLMVKKDGKPFYKVNYVVTADGKSMTATGGATVANEKVKMVYDRQ